MLFPAPDLVVEIISPSTEKNDRGVKFIDYALHGIQEYWIADPQQQSVEQYFLEKNQYQLMFQGRSKQLVSKALPGFTIEAEAIFNREENTKALQQILAS